MLEEGSTVEVDFFNKEVAQPGNKHTLAKISFPCSLQQYYDFILADKATLLSFSEYLELRGAEAIKLTDWRKSEELGREVREVNAVIRVSGVPLMSQARMHQIHTMSRSEKDIEISTVTQMSDIPYAAYFTVEQQLQVK